MIKKLKKIANWMTVPGAQPIRTMAAKEKRTPTRSKRIRPESDKRKSERKIYNELRIPFLQANPFCQRCNAPSQCVHHWAGRRSNYLKQETWRASCISCNDFAKNSPAEARAENWIAPIGIYLV
jgi:hypothetical protein